MSYLKALKQAKKGLFRSYWRPAKDSKRPPESPSGPVVRCVCCGSQHLAPSKILWQALIDEWRLSCEEAAYIDRQQGLRCTSCHTNLRSMALAQAIMRCFSYPDLFQDFIKHKSARNLRVLEINEAGNLNRLLSRLPGHRVVSYPEVDMLHLPFAEASFDLVVHSDTLEHVVDPIRGLEECRRVLRDDGFCAFTIPIIVDRPTISRQGLLPSYHGTGETSNSDLLVHTEYGYDAWRQVIQAGFRECRIVSLEYPAALAIVAVK